MRADVVPDIMTAEQLFSLETPGKNPRQDTGFRIASDPDTVRAPDFAFLKRERAVEIRPHGYGAFAPDLVAEIVDLHGSWTGRT